MKMVVTDADTEKRIVRELNAEPAATEYAQVGVVESSSTPPLSPRIRCMVGVGGNITPARSRR